MERESAAPAIWFGVIVAVFCVWVFSLPLFPSQDGPMHRYYVHALSLVLDHAPQYQIYNIRHPFPPYATHYLALLLLYKFFSYDLAEKIFTCGLIISFGYGFRFCATAIGPLGRTLSLYTAPLFLHWAVLMGFFNYDLALALFLFACGFWMRAQEGKRWFWLGYALIVMLLAVTHPVPLLVLAGLGTVDLVLTLVRPLAPVTPTEFMEHNRWRIAALIFTCACFIYPALSIDRSHSSGTLQEIGLHKAFVTTAMLLTGVSPYNTRSTSLLINLYRLSLYAMLAGALYLAFRGFMTNWRDRRLSLGDSFFVSTVLLGLSLPVLPDSVNGSYYFATRLVVLLWIGALLAASGYRVGLESLRRKLVPVGLVFALIALMTAEIYVRPVARAVRSIEQQPLPSKTYGIILVGKGLDNWSRFHTQIAADFFEWSLVLPMTGQDDIALDTPWLEQNILPLRAVEGTPLFIGDIRHSPFLNPLMTAPGAVPASAIARTVDAASFVLYAGTQEELALGLASRLPARAAGRFQCSQHDWYFVCQLPSGGVHETSGR